MSQDDKYSALAHRIEQTVKGTQFEVPFTDEELLDIVTALRAFAPSAERTITADHGKPYTHPVVSNVVDASPSSERTQEPIRSFEEFSIVGVIRQIGIKAGVAPEVYGAMCHEVRAILAAASATSALNGYVLVPEEPTQEMLDAARYARDCPVTGTDDLRDLYLAMVQARPEIEGAAEGRDA